MRKIAATLGLITVASALFVFFAIVQIRIDILVLAFSAYAS